MSFTIQYRPLFELQTRHDYYLNLETEGSFYELDEEDDKETIQTLLRKYSAVEDFEFDPLPSTRAFLRSHKMVFRSDKTGFKIFVSVSSDVDPDGATLFTPQMELPDSFSLYFALKINNPFFWNFSNINLLPSTSSLFYFSNIPETDKEYPSLSLTPARHISGRTRKYEMGELVSNNSGNVYQALQRTDKALNSSTSWEKITNHQYVNGKDRRLIPVLEEQIYNGVTEEYERKNIIHFHYRPIGELDETALTFRLENDDGPVAELQDVPVRRIMSLKMIIEEEGGHTLFVEGVNGFSEEIPLMLLLSPFTNLAGYGINTMAGLIEIRHEAGLNDFRLLEDAGHLKITGSGADKKLDLPSFQLRYKSRSTYWEYLLAKGDTPANAGDLQISTEKENAVVTTSAHPLQQSRIEIQYNVSNGLPNPSAGSIQPRADGRIYSEIYLPKLS